MRHDFCFVITELSSMRFFSKLILGIKLVFYKRSYLNKTGYVRSKISDSLKNENGEFLPWMNYSIIELLKERLQKDHTVFEYGSGASTMFWAKHCASVSSIEYDEKWYHLIRTHIEKLDNAQLRFQEVNQQYIEAISHDDSSASFDLVIVDGRKRVECAQYALPYLSTRGVLILDDSGRPHYQEAFDSFRNAGFKALTLKGLKPTGFGMDQSTIFYRSESNILDL